jgi:cell division protein FtsL
MLKLLLCLITASALAVAMLHLRQQRLELNYQCNRLHTQIERSKARIWNQQLEIAIYTAPNAISRTVGDHELNLVPQTPSSTITTHWLDVTRHPDAE